MRGYSKLQQALKAIRELPADGMPQRVVCHKKRKRASHCRSHAEVSKVCHSESEIYNFFTGKSFTGKKFNVFDPMHLLRKNAGPCRMIVKKDKATKESKHAHS